MWLRRDRLFFCFFVSTLALWTYLILYSLKVPVSNPEENPHSSFTKPQIDKDRPGRDQVVTPVPYQRPIIRNETEKPIEFYRNSKPVVVLLWDSISPFGWAQGRVINTPNYAGWTYDKGECPVECIFTGDRNYLNSADVMLFDACLTGPYEWGEIPVYFPEKREDQIWMWFAYEQQYYFPQLQQEKYTKKFDYKMTYHHDSLVQVTFTCPWGNINTFLDPPPPKSKDKVVVFMGSNCNTGGADERTAYVKELMKYIHVDSYGGCLHNKDMEDYQKKNGRRSHGDKIIEKIGIISEYKFLLAFENNNKVPDYVTEKMTNAIQAGTVPVYWGAPNVDMWTPGEHSIIKTTDFASPKELAEYLNMLNNNDEEYYKYFEWKRKGLSEQYQRLLNNCIFFAECRLCKKIAEMRDPNSARALMPKKPEPINDCWALKLNALDTRASREDQFVRIGSHSKALDLEEAFTLAAWINLNLIQDGRIIDKAQAGRVDGYSMDVLKHDGGPRGKLRVCIAGGCNVGKRYLYTGVWYHVASTFDYKTGSLKLFVNGEQDSEHTVNSKVPTNNYALTFGRAASGGGSWRPHHQSSIFDGIIDDISIWNIPLSEAEVEDLMFKRLSGKERGLVGCWQFNEGQGHVVHDCSPNQLDGTITGQAQWVQAITKPVVDASWLENRHK